MSDLAEMHTRATRGVLWNATTQGLSKAVVVVSTMVLARLLVPSEFGLFAVGLLVINYLDRLKDAGVGASLVYRPESWARLARTGLSLSVASSFVLAALAVVVAEPMAAFFHEPEVAGLVRALAVALFVNGLFTVPESRLRRELDFKRRVVPETTAAVLKGGVSVGMALAGFGVWSLVVGQIAGNLVQLVLYWVVAGWRPRFGFDPGDAGKLLRYGIPSATVALFAVVIENVDYLVVGHRMNAEAMGYYTLAYRLPELLVIGVCILVGQVLFPFFSRLQDDGPALRRSYLGAVRHVTLLLVPVALLLSLLAGDLVDVAYSSRWDPAVPVLRLLALFALVYALGFHAGEVYKAIGRPGILNAVAVVRLTILVPALWVAAGYSIVAVAAAMVLSQVVITLLELVVVSHFLTLRAADFLLAWRPTVVAAAALTVSVLVGSAAVPGAPALVRLVGLSVLGLGCYVLALRLTAPQVLAQWVGTVRALRRPAPVLAGPADGGAR